MRMTMMIMMAKSFLVILILLFISHQYDSYLYYRHYRCVNNNYNNNYNINQSKYLFRNHVYHPKINPLENNHRLPKLLSERVLVFNRQYFVHSMIIILSFIMTTIPTFVSASTTTITITTTISDRSQSQISLKYISSMFSTFKPDQDDNNRKLTNRQVIIRQTENFLTNPLLERIRIVDQFDPDTGFQGVNRAILLLPIVEIYHDMETIDKYLHIMDSNRLMSSLIKANELLKNSNYDKVIFKKIFNRYSDNIFYSNPRQANIYLAGGTMPNSRQTQQYLYRNEALTSISNVKEDIESLLQQLPSSSSSSSSSFSVNFNEQDRQSVEDTIDDCKEALDALKSYLDLADPKDVDTAKQIVYQRKMT